jgi:hypothetical protein
MEQVNQEAQYEKPEYGIGRTGMFSGDNSLSRL